MRSILTYLYNAILAILYLRIRKDSIQSSTHQVKTKESITMSRAKRGEEFTRKPQ